MNLCCNIAHDSTRENLLIMMDEDFTHDEIILRASAFVLTGAEKKVFGGFKSKSCLQLARSLLLVRG